MSEPVMHHRTAEFKGIFARAQAKLAQVFFVDEVIILSASGSAAFEAGMLAAVPAKAKVLAINAGKFGERWLLLAQKYGYEVIEIKIPWGKTVDFKVLEDTLKSEPDIKAVMTTHSETSTGVLHDVKKIAKTVKQELPDALVLVDAVSSLAAAELRPKEWGLDMVSAGSQKGLMMPPGLAFVYMSQRAWASKTNLKPSFYLDIRKERISQQKNTTAYTSPVNMIYALDAALDIIIAEGIENLWQKRALYTEAILQSAELLGCSRFAQRVSPAVAALRAPEGIKAADIVAEFAKRGLRIAGGQDHVKEFLFRPAVLGYGDKYDVITVVAVLEEVLRELGLDIPYAKGVAKAMQVLG
ncbi:MAG TPA: alanine--glyoxylate aminotransferase family protein [Trueperaceae bacterium]|nr:alanine--glyoxylate aminotransferase family protein [Trueperaceae bacterium]